MQHTRTAIAFACWNLLLFVGLKTITNASGQMRQPYSHVTVMLQMNPPKESALLLLLFFFSLSLKARVAMRFTAD